MHEGWHADTAERRRRARVPSLESHDDDDDASTRNVRAITSEKKSLLIHRAPSALVTSHGRRAPSFAWAKIPPLPLFA